MGCGSSKSTETADGTKKEKKEKKKIDDIEIKVVNIPDIDSLFEKAAAPIKTMIDMRKALDDAVSGLKTLAEQAENPKEAFQKCLKDLKEGLGDIELKLEFSTEGIKFAGIDDETLPGHVKEIYDAFKNLFEGVKTIITSCPKIVEDFKALVEEAQKLKDNLPQIAKDAGLSPLQIPKALKNAGVNIKNLAKAPIVTKDLLVQAKDTTKDLKDIFKGLTGKKVDGDEEGEN